MSKETEKQIEESYDHIKPYLKDQKELKEMCNRCEGKCDSDHNYEECKDKMSFKFFLAYSYMEWINSFR